MSDLPYLGGQFDPAVVRLIEHVTIATAEPAVQRMWSEEHVASVRQSLINAYGRVPTLDDLGQYYGADFVREMSGRILRERFAVWDRELAQSTAAAMQRAEQGMQRLREHEERMGLGSPCHLCGAARGDHDPSYDFGLAHVIEDKREWGGALAMLALNVVTVPLGVGVAATPGRSKRAHIAHCRLVLCGSCGHARKGFWGGLNIGIADCARHPSWQRLQAAGLDTFLTSEMLAEYR